ncbi:hypothetical protein BH09PAT4_BH09PAT4_03210 [soil metagenome]
MRNACAKSVYSLGTQLVQPAPLLTGLVANALKGVHITRHYPLTLSQLCHRGVHNFFMFFTAVSAGFIPTIHRTYNKQPQIR